MNIGHNVPHLCPKSDDLLLDGDTRARDEGLLPQAGGLY